MLAGVTGCGVSAGRTGFRNLDSGRVCLGVWNCTDRVDSSAAPGGSGEEVRILSAGLRR